MELQHVTSLVYKQMLLVCESSLYKNVLIKAFYFILHLCLMLTHLLHKRKVLFVEKSVNSLKVCIFCTYCSALNCLGFQG